MQSSNFQVGIPVFVTGGIGGVHRHGENSEYPFAKFSNHQFFFLT